MEKLIDDLTCDILNTLMEAENNPQLLVNSNLFFPNNISVDCELMTCEPTILLDVIRLCNLYKIAPERQTNFIKGLYFSLRDAASAGNTTKEWDLEWCKLVENKENNNLFVQLKIDRIFHPSTQPLVWIKAWSDSINNLNQGKN